MVIAVLMMSFGSLMVACLPTYASVGVAAPVLLTVARVIQGISVGGEIGSFEGTSLEFIPGIGRFDDEIAQLMTDMSLAANAPLNWNVLAVTPATLDAGFEKLEQWTDEWGIFTVSLAVRA